MAFESSLAAIRSKAKSKLYDSNHNHNNSAGKENRKSKDANPTQQHNMKPVEVVERLDTLSSSSAGGDHHLSEVDMHESGYINDRESPVFSDVVCEETSLNSDVDIRCMHGQEEPERNGFETRVDLIKRFTTGDGLGCDSPRSLHRNGISKHEHEMETHVNHANWHLSPNHTDKPSGWRSSVNSSICSDESLDGELLHEYSRLTTLMENIDPKRLHNYLKRKLKQNDPGTVLVMSSLFPKTKFKAETLHCVRCHKEFDPKHGDKVCRLFHQEKDVMKISEDVTGSDFGCERCGAVFRIEGKWKYKQSYNKKHDCGPCFIGKHTVSTDEIDYEPTGTAKTCEDYGCMVFYV
eukprot:gene17570-19322_t